MKVLFHQKIESSFFFYLNPKILAKLFNLIYCVILISTRTLAPQLSCNPNHKPHKVCAVWGLWDEYVYEYDDENVW